MTTETTIENYCIDCKSVALPDCEQRGHVVGTLGHVTEQPSHEQPASARVESDPWKAVHRIKVKHEKMVEAAITTINCYQWQGQERAKYLAEAMNELDKAVAALQGQPASSEQDHATQLHFLANRAEELSSLLAGMTTERDELREALRQARAAAQIRSDLNLRLHGRPTSESWVPIADALLNHAEQGEGS